MASRRDIFGQEWHNRKSLPANKDKYSGSNRLVMAVGSFSWVRQGVKDFKPMWPSFHEGFGQFLYQWSEDVGVMGF